jgi:hypothetical protein
MYRVPYRFVGRWGDRYVWERPLANSSHVEQITCSVDWFWGRRG